MKLLVFSLLLSISCCSASPAARSGSVKFQPWLVGLTAVVGFLLLVFVVLIIKRLLKKSRDNEGGATYDQIMEAGEGDTKQTSL